MRDEFEFVEVSIMRIEHIAYVCERLRKDKRFLCQIF